MVQALHQGATTRPESSALQAVPSPLPQEHESFCDLVKEARDGNWFPQYEGHNAIGQPGICLDILILGALRYLRRGWTFDDISESTNVSEECHRRFFRDFTIACREHLYPKWVKCPETPGRWNDQTIVHFDGFVTDI